MSDEHAHDEPHHVNYFNIFLLLCVCTFLSVVFDVTKGWMSRTVLVSLILGVATCKATFVLLYFMHIKFETAWKYVLLAPTTVLAFCVPFALAPDISFHYYDVIVPQSYVVPSDHAGGGHGAAQGTDAHANKHDANHKDEHKEGHKDEHKAGADDHAAPKKTDDHGKKKADEPKKESHPETKEKPKDKQDK